MNNFYERLTIHTERGNKAVEKAILEEKETKNKLIREKMQELKKINELEEYAMKDIIFWTKAYNNTVKKIENLKEKRKEILTELNYLAK